MTSGDLMGAAFIAVSLLALLWWLRKDLWS